MPRSVRLALAGTSILAIAHVFLRLRVRSLESLLAPGFWLWLLFALWVLSGLVRRKPLCWQAAYLGTLASLILSVPLLAWWVHSSFFSGDVVPVEKLIVVVGQLLFYVGLGLGVPWLIIRALRHPSSRVWFHLVCPFCGSEKTRSADLLFRDIVCKKCGAGWRGGGQPVGPADAGRPAGA